MKRDPFDDLFSILFEPRRDQRAWLWNPFDPSTLFCVLMAVAATVVIALLRGGG
jgi:hypothetical protein